MALSTDPSTRRYTYADLEHFPDDNLRREIVDGELFETGTPMVRHQKAVGNVVFHIERFRRGRIGGETFLGPLDVVFAEDNVVVPDVLFVAAHHMDRIGEKYIDGTPDIVVEVSSPETRRLELVRKRELYQRFGVPEYWFVDLEAERVEIYRLTEGIYPPPDIKYPGDVVESTVLSGFSMSVDEALAVEAQRRRPEDGSEA
jgi:Uma2 family endonuclease